MPMRFLPSTRFTLNSLRSQLVLWVALPIATLVLAISLSEVRGHEQAMHRLAQDRADSLVKAAAALISVQIDHNKDVLLQLASNPLFHSAAATLETKIEVMGQARPSFSSGLVLYDFQGEGIGTTDAGPWSSWPVSGATARTVAASGSPATVAVQDPQSQEWLLLYMVPLPAEDDQPQGALAGLSRVDPLALAKLSQSLSLSAATHLTLVDSASGAVVQEIAAPEVNRPGWTEKTAMARAIVPNIGWKVELQESWADLVPPILRFESVAFFAVAIAILTSLLSFYFGLRSIVTPLQRLDAAARQIGWGNFDAIQEPVGGVREIEELRLALAQMTDQVRQSQQELQSYVGSVTLGQEEERKRLARELHDDTVQALIALNQQLELVERRLQTDPQAAAERLHEVRPLVGETITGVRRQIQDLRPLYLEDLGFVPALDMLVRQIGERHPLVGDFEVTGLPPRRLSPALEIGVYRIAQEALRNVVAHAQATWVHVELNFEPQGLTLRIEDDGQGFAVPIQPYLLAQSGHFGLLGMQERAQLHGGAFRVESAPGQGATIIVALPALAEE